MGRNKSLNATEIAKIEAYRDQNLSNRAIAKKLNRSPKVINNYLKNPLLYGNNYKGRASVLSNRKTENYKIGFQFNQFSKQN